MTGVTVGKRVVDVKKEKGIWSTSRREPKGDFRSAGRKKT